MAEELFVCIAPNGGTFKCAASQLQKHAGKDPFDRPLSAAQKTKWGV